MKIRSVRLLALLLPVACTTALAAAQGASRLVASRHESAPPDGLAPSIAAALAPGGVRVTAGRTPLEFWFVSALPLEPGSPGASWAAVDEGALIGLVRIAEPFRDIRGRTIKPGVYTLRYGLQPDNGDHLGVSPYREFLLLSPASEDSDAAPRGHEGTIEISKLAAGGSHPTALSLDPPVATAEPLQATRTELGHDALVLEVPVSRDGKPAGALRFGLVLIGRIEA